MNDLLQQLIWQAAATVDHWRVGAIGFLLVVIAGCLTTVAWVIDEVRS